MAQRNYLINTTTISTTASGSTIGSGNTTSATFAVARTLVRTGMAAGELASGSQTWSVHYVVSAMATPYEMRLKLQRLNSSGVMQSESGFTTVRSATGTYDDNLTWDSSAWNANDQLALVWEHRRPSGTGSKNGTLDANGASYIDAPTSPLDLPQTLADDVNNFADARGLGYGNLYADSLNPLADSAQIVVGYPLTLSDNANSLTDGAVKVVGMLSTTNDSLQSLTDALTRLLSYELAFADSEAANWADAHQLLLSQFLALSDLYALSDSVVLSAGQSTQFADVLNAFSDALDLQVGVAFPVADNADNISDGFSLQLNHFLNLSDTNSSFPSAPILDDFNRANEGPPPSANWTNGIAEGFGFSFGHRVLDNELQNATEGVAQNYWNVETFGPDCEAYITAVNTADAPSTWLVGRLVDPGLSTCTGYAVQVVSSNAGDDRLYFIYRIDDGLLTSIASTSETGVGPADGDKYGIRIIGDIIYLWGDTGDSWEIKLSVSDSTYSSAGFIGIVTEAATLSPRWDDFGGGTVVSGLVDAFSYELSIGPSLSLELSDPLASLADSLTLGRGLLPVDMMGSLTDALTLRGDSQLAAAGALTLDDSEAHVIELLLTFAETISLDDSLSSGHGLICADSFALLDAVVIRLDYLISTDDSLTLADSESHSLDHLVAITDNLNLLADSIAPQLGQRVDLADFLLSFTDSYTPELDHRFSFSETISLIDDYADDLINTVEGTTEELADNINLLADGLSLGVGLALIDNAANLTDTETRTLGQSLTLTPGSVANLNDEIALQLHKFLDFSDSLTLADGESATLGQYELLTDTIATFVDAATIQLDQQLTLTDSLNNLADASTQVVGFQLNFSDVLPLMDVAQLGYGLGLTDDIDLLVDSIITSAPQGPLRQAGVTDSIDTLVDVVELRLDYLLATADVISLTDSLALNEGLLITFTDSFTLTDTTTSTLGHLLPLVDSFALSDAIQLQVGQQLAVDDALTFADSIALRLDYHLAANDVFSLTDAVTLGQDLLITLTDALSLSDMVVADLRHVLSLTDSLTFADAIQLRLDYGLVLTDVVVLSDSETAALSHHLSLTDNAALLADSLAKSLGLILILNDDAPTLVDAVELFSAWLLQFTDILALTDSLTRFSAGFLALDDSFLLADNAVIDLRGPDLDAALSDSLTLTDAITLSLGDELQLQLVVSDTITLLDHYFDLRRPYTPSARRYIVVPSAARVTVPTARTGVVVPPRNRTTRVP